MEAGILHMMEYKQIRSSSSVSLGSLSGYEKWQNIPAHIVFDEAYNMLAAYFFNLAHSATAKTAATKATMDTVLNGTEIRAIARSATHRSTWRAVGLSCHRMGDGWSAYGRSPDSCTVTPAIGGDWFIVNNMSEINNTVWDQVVGSGEHSALGRDGAYAWHTATAFTGGLAWTGQKKNDYGPCMAVIALPDAKSVLIHMKKAAYGGLDRWNWFIANWICNGNVRKVFHAGGTETYSWSGLERAYQSYGPWISVDGVIVYKGLYTPGANNIAVSLRDNPFLYDESDPDTGDFLGTPPGVMPCRWPADSFSNTDCAIAVVCSPSVMTQAGSAVIAGLITGSKITVSNSKTQATWVDTGSGAAYLIVSNYNAGSQVMSLTLPHSVSSFQSLVGGSPAISGTSYSLTLAAKTTNVVKITNWS